MTHRAAAYAVVVALAGVAAWVWFTLTEEVPPDSNDPAAYDFLLGVTVVAALVAAVVFCVLVELGVRLRAWAGRRSRRPAA